MAVVGIDLGTTNTVVAAVRDGRAAALKDRLGRALLPSVVSFPPKGDPKIGYEGKHRRTLDPENTIFSIKRLIGRSWDSEHVQTARGRFPFELREGPGKATLVRVQGEDHTLPEISALVLSEARRIAEERLGQQVTDCVLTVPANFNDLQRAATKVAGRVAGLQVGRILNEPTAAALAYGFGKKGRERIAVYDFGGGTFDVTLLDLSENVFEVLSTAGDTFLGGDDLDYAIVLRMGEELMKKHRVDMSTDTLVREQLRAAAEKIKMDLSTRSMSKVTIEEIGFSAGKAVNFEFSMRRSEFEALAEPFIERTLKVCQEALDVAGVATKELGEILLVGGSTRIPLVRRRLSSFFGKMPQARINPDEVVAIGAAIQAAALESKLTGGSVPGPPMPGHPRPGTVRSPLPAPDAPEQSATTGNTKLGLASAPATFGDARVAPPRPKMQTLSGVGTEPGGVHLRQRPRTLLGLGDDFGGEADLDDANSPRTVTGIGQSPTPEELARFAGVSDAMSDADDGPTGRIALSSFDDVTSVIRMPDQIAKLQDREAAARESIDDGPVFPATEEGSVSFDLAELEANAAAAAALEADLPVVQVPGVPVDLDQITEVSGLLEIPEDEEDEEADLPVVATQPPAPPPAAAPKVPAQFATPYARLNKTMLGTGPAGPELPSPLGRTTAGVGLPLPARGRPDASAGLPSVRPQVAPELPSVRPSTGPGLPSLRPQPGAGLPSVRPQGSPGLPSVRAAEPPVVARPRVGSATPALRSGSGEHRLGLAGTQVMPGGGAGPEDDLDPLESTAVTGTRASSVDPGELAADLLDADQPDGDTDILGSMTPLDGRSPGPPPPRARAPSIDESIEASLISRPPPSGAMAQTMVGSFAEVARVRPPLLIDVTPLALGVETTGGYADTLIERNSPIPCERTRTFTTARDHQQVVRVRVSQGDYARFSDNTVLGEVELSGLEPALRGSIRIDVTFSLDESGLLAVSARHQGTGASVSATLHLIGLGER